MTMDRFAGLEEKTGEVGRQIFSMIGDQVPSLFDKKRWTGKLMEWAMKDEQVKVQLFRFVDVLPCLKSDDMVLRVLSEYFDDPDQTPILRGIGLMSRRGFFPRVAGRFIRKNVETLARQFIAGADPDDAWPTLDALRNQGLAVSVDLLGEEVLSQNEAAIYAQRYIDLLDAMSRRVRQWQTVPILDNDGSGAIPRLDVSVKVSSFSCRLEPMDWEHSVNDTVGSLQPLMDAAKERDVAVTFDMESYYFKDLVIAIVKRLLAGYTGGPHAGIALQAYLKESREDLMDLVSWAKKHRRRLGVRLTKGAYWDYETVVNRQRGWPVPVLMEKGQTDARFEELTRTLLENAAHVRPALATHNIRSICHAIATADTLNVPKEALEFQMIYGMAEPIRSALQKMGYRVRVYAPIGQLIPGMAYLIRRLLENTSNESFLRKSFSEGTSAEELTRPPRTGVSEEPQGLETRSFVNEPLTDFSKAENRDRMRDALVQVRKAMGRTYPLVIGKDEVRSERLIRSINPSRPSEVVGSVSAANQSHADEAVEKARTAWATWRRTPVADRAHYLFSAAAIMLKRKYELAALQVYEVGKNWIEADADVAEAIDFLEYYGKEMIKIGSPQVLGGYPGEENVSVYEPRGVGVVIAPWNFPLAIATGMVSAGIVTGNCIVFKPSSLSPVIGWELFDAFRKAGLPQGVLQFLPGSGEEIGDRLVSHPDVDFVAFTGSRDVGLRIVQLAGQTVGDQRNVKKVIAEMGGKNAIIVDDTADLDAAIKGVTESALGFQGQKCSACSRVIVVGAVYDEFCARLKQAMTSVSIGPPDDPHYDMGPVIDETALRKMRHFRELGKTCGREVLAVETRSDGYYVGPVIFADVDPHSALAQEEIFGPIVSVMHAKDIDEALRIANNTRYALTGGVFSRSPGNIRKVEAEFRVGNLYINRKITGALVGRQPFGGFGMSGIGSKAGGPDYLLQFVHARCVSENTLRRGFAPRPQARPQERNRNNPAGSS
jgi:RHH-type transcriptional regulator, proline utilization regulon repressor / proline dehydrogenase / delta 1-pyrroline-5-carboxylate dehydrogenase